MLAAPSGIANSCALRIDKETPADLDLHLILAKITEQRIRRGAFNSVAELKKAIMDYLGQHNAPKPFVWTASAGAILEKVAIGEVFEPELLIAVKN